MTSRSRIGPLPPWPTAIQREIVESISARQVGRYLAEADLKPHLSRYWLNPDVDDPQEFEANVRRVCDLYAEAPQLAEDGVEVHSTDEMTGMCACKSRLLTGRGRNRNLPMAR